MKAQLFVLILVLFQSFSFAQNAYQIGEELQYRLYYNSAMTGNVTAGEILTKVESTKNTGQHHVVLRGQTKGAFSWFFKADDTYETWINSQTQLPYYFRKRVQEGSYSESKDVQFFQSTGDIKAINNKNQDVRTYKTQFKVQDLLSSFYHIRNWDFNNIKNGHSFTINLFMDDSVYQIDFQYIGIQTIKTKLGKIECMVFMPRVLTGAVFADDQPMRIYVSNDNNRIPIMAESELMVGRARMELSSYQNLKYPIRFTK